MEKNAEPTRERLEMYAKRGWTKQGNGTKARYLKRSNTTPILKELLEPTVTNLTNADNWMGQEQFQYRWSDFLFAKTNNDAIPNNHLLTLRRFPAPVNDNATMADQIQSRQHLLPIATAVTWLSDACNNSLSDILGFSFKLNWRDVKAEVNEVQGNEQGAESSPMGEGVAKW